MFYKALYRKYRPTNFNDVFGQNIPIKILKNAVINKKISHAYLFSGPRGTGKTSLAKILSKIVNCENPIEKIIPCEKCDSCLSTFANENIDIIEIDAASNNGVDEIRELKSKVNFVPTVLKYKVYIIDEVHMLSSGAFNALLKTLEEPPEYTIFILATTELQKVPLTIISRCQVLEFKKIDFQSIHDRLLYISNSEKINIDDDAIFEIAENSDGCMRDAINLLDKVASYVDNNITVEDVRIVCDSISDNQINDLINYLINKDSYLFNQNIETYYIEGKNIVKIMDDIIKILKTKLKNLNGKTKLNICSILSQVICITDKIRKTSSNQLILLQTEIILLFKQNIMNDKLDDDNVDLFIKESKKTDELLKSECNIIQDKTATLNSKIENMKKIRVNNTFVDANKFELNKIKEKWKELSNKAFDKEYGSYICMLIDSIPVAASSKYLILTCKYDSLVDKSNNLFVKLENAYKFAMNDSKKIVFLTYEEWKKYVNQYVENKKNQTEYKYIDENDNSNTIDKVDCDILEKNTNNKIENKITDLFGNNIVEIR